MSRISQLGQCLVEKFGLSEQHSEEFVTNLFEIIREKLLADNIVKVKGLGTFKLAEMNARESVSVNTGERITIEGRYKLSFTPENAVRDRINSPFASFESMDLDEEVDFSSIDEKYADSSETVETIEPLLSEPVEVVTPQASPEEPAVEEPAPESTDSAIEPLLDVVEESSEDIITEEEPIAEEKAILEKEPEMQPSLFDSDEVLPAEDTESQSVSEKNEPEATSSANANTDTSDTPEATVHASDNVSESNTVVRAPVCEELIQKNMNRNQTIINLLHWVIGLIILVLLCFGAYFIYNVGREDGAMQYYIHHNNVVANDVREAMKDSITVPATQPTAEDQPKHDISLVKTPGAKPVAKPAPTSKPVPTPTPTANATAKASTANATANISNLYNNKDARVRTGAYNIVGTQTTVTVQPGQTLKGISKAYLGDGMECYIEAYNGGKKTFKAGEKVNIPKLVLKKKLKK